MIAEAEHILSTTTLPEGRSERARELLGASIKLADDLLEQSPAAALGAKGGEATRKLMKSRDPEYYKKIAAMRKTRSGGRPKKPTPGPGLKT